MTEIKTQLIIWSTYLDYQKEKTILLYMFIMYTAGQTFLSLILTKAAFIWSKIRQSHQYCEILLQFKIEYFFLS